MIGLSDRLRDCPGPCVTRGHLDADLCVRCEAAREIDRLSKIVDAADAMYAAAQSGEDDDYGAFSSFQQLR